MAKLRADPERFAAFKEKERQRYHKNKAKAKKANCEGDVASTKTMYFSLLQWRIR